jgi:hypothetical protein
MQGQYREFGLLVHVTVKMLVPHASMTKTRLQENSVHSSQRAEVTMSLSCKG